MDPQMKVFATRFILNLSAAVERSGLSVLRPVFPEADAQLIRRAYESRAREGLTENTPEVESSDLRQFPMDDAVGLRFLFECTTIWDTPSCADEAESADPRREPKTPTTPRTSLSGPSPAASPRESGASETISISPQPASPVRRRPGRKVKKNVHRCLRLQYLVFILHQPGQLDYLECFVRRIHSKGHSAYQCVICPHTSERKHDVKRHAAIHECVPGPYLCYGCNRRFKRTEGRTRHWAVHPDCKEVDERISAESDNYNTRHGRSRRRKLATFTTFTN